MSKTFKSEGIVFKSLKYSETSLILDIYTKQKGLGSYIVSGVRKSKSKMINVYNPINILDLVAYNSENALARIKEASFAYKYQQINFDVIRSSIAAFVVDVLRNSIKEKEPNLELYTFIYDQLIQLDSSTKISSLFPIQFCIKLAAYLGFQLDNNFSNENQYFDLRLCQFIDNDVRHQQIINIDRSAILSNILSNKIENTPTKLDRQAILDDLVTYFSLHIEGFSKLKSLAVLRAVLA